MKTFLFIISILFFLQGMANPMMRTTPKRAPVVGKVKTVRSYNSLSSMDEKEIRSWGKDHYSVDSYSNTGLKFQKRVVFGKEAQLMKYKYNKKGKLIEETVVEGASKETVLKTYKYNATGDLIQETNYISGQFHFCKKYTYASGILVSSVDSSSSSLTTTYYTCDNKGRILEKVSYLYGASTMDTSRYTWYDNGNMRSEAFMSYDGENKTMYTYDEHNNEIVAEEKVNDGPVTRWFVSKYIYDSSGNWTKCIEDIPEDRGPLKRMLIRDIEYY